MNSQHKHVFLLAAIILLVTAAWLHAGPLSPPAGPIVGTGKTTQEIFDKVAESEPRIAVTAANTPGDADSVFKITQPGSYYLVANLTGQSGKMGIEIATGNVTLDLNGFVVSGVTGALRGIAQTGSGHSVIIRNGTVTGWGSHGIELSLITTATGFRVEDVNAIQNVGDGIRCISPMHVLRCAANLNLGNGIFAGRGSVVEDCIAVSNSAIGITTGEAVVLNRCASRLNGSIGIALGGAGSVVTDCVAFFNTADGFSGSGVGAACAFRGCSAVQNGGVGFLTQVDCIIESCTARLNGSHGYSGGSNTLIRHCTATSNTGDGIRFGAGGCLALNNTCDNNGAGTGDGAGIHVLSNRSRVEGNVCNANDRGIDVDTSGNIIVRNTCSGNATNWDVAANNACLVVGATVSGAITGNSGGVSPGSSDPNANFTH